MSEGAEKLRILHLNHVNAVVENFEASVRHLQDLYGAQLILDMPRAEWHACLVSFGTVIFELFAPHDILVMARYGPHFVGVEYQIAGTVDEARRLAGERRIRIARDIEAAFHTHPADTYGIALEVFDKSFHDDPPPVSYLEPMRSRAYWRDEHPLGCYGLKRLSVAVGDLDEALEFFTSLTDASVEYEVPRERVGAQAVGLRWGDSTMELLTPVGEGVLARHLARYGDGIRSTVFAVRDIRQAREYLASKGMPLHEGDAEDTLAVAPGHNLGLLFEFSE